MAIVSLNPLAELYFHGRITREDAEELLRNGPNGKFLLRSREVVNTGVDIFIISVCFEHQVLHYSVDRRPDGTYNIPGGKQFIGPVEIVRYHTTSQDGIKTLLSQPVNRPPDLGAVVYWGLTTDIVESELFSSGGLSRETAGEEVYRIFANSSTNKPYRFREFLRQMQYSRSWFHGAAGREEAEQRLQACGMRSGTFLVRRKKDCFVLSVIHDRLFKHYLIRERQNPGGASGHSRALSPSSPTGTISSAVCGYGMDGGPLFSSLIELVHWYHAYSDGLPCALLYPCSNAPPADHNSDTTSDHVQSPVRQLSSPPSSNDVNRSFIPTAKLISVVDDLLPSSPTNDSPSGKRDAEPIVIRNKLKSPPKNEELPPPPPSLSENNEAANETTRSSLDDELAKKLDLIAMEMHVSQHVSPKPSPELVSSRAGNARPAVAVRPTPVIPMCKPASMPIPPDPPSLKSKEKDHHHQQHSVVKAEKDISAMETSKTVITANGGSKLVPTKRVIRLPQSLARKTAMESSTNGGLVVSSRRQALNETANEQRNSPSFKPVSAQNRTVSPPTPRSAQLKTTLIFDTVHSPAHPISGSGSTGNGRVVPKDDWDEPSSGGGDPISAVGGAVNGGSNRSNGFHNGSFNRKPQQLNSSPIGSNNKSLIEPLVLQDSVTRLDPDWLEIHQTIGHGHFGTVLFGYLITPQNRIPVAIKSVRETESRCVENLVKEATTMSNLTHPNIITFFGVCYIETILLVMEYAPLGTLQKFIRANRSFPIIRIVKLMIQVADAMRYLEKNKLVHRDLACRNVLLLSEDQAKISDFGMSRALDVQRDYYKSHNVGKWPLKWYPPEAIYYWKFDSKTDVWSYGVTLWEATSYGARPYQGMDGWQVLKFIESGKRLDRPPACPPQLYCLMNECWKFKSSERPTFEEVLVTMLDIDCQLAANDASAG